MTTQRFPLQRLPDDLGLMVLNTMEYHEILAFSFTSKKSVSMVQALRLPIRHVKLNSPSDISVFFDRAYYSFYLKIHGNDDQIRTLNDLPANVDIRAISPGNSQRLTWSNQGKTFGNWIHHFCSISKPETRYLVSIETKRMRFEIDSLRNTFPKLRKITIKCSRDESTENCLSSSETVLRAFLPNLESLVLYGLPPNHSIGNIGMANLNSLEVYHDHSPLKLKIEDFLSLNVRSLIIKVHEFSLRDLNRFFKLWLKGSNPRLEDLEIYGHFERFPDWNVLLNGLKAVEKEEVVEDEDEEESEDEDEADGTDEAQEGRVKAVEAENESEDEAQEERHEEEKAVAGGVPKDAQDEEGQEEEEEVEEEDDEEYEDEELKLDDDEEESKGEDEADEAQEERLEEEEAVEEEEPKVAEDEKVEEEDGEEYEDEESELDEEEDEEDEMKEAPVARRAQRAQVEQDEEDEEEIPLERREGAENAGIVKKYIIRNCLGVCAEIETEFNINFYVTASVKFTVKK